MYKLGHQGLNLALYAPVLLVAVLTGWGALGLIGGVIVFATASLPDVDMRLPGVAHRGITHTVWAALAVGLVGFGGTLALAANADLRISGLVLAGAVGGSLIFSVLSHIAGDALTPMGIRPFAPLDGREYSLEVCRADSWLGNRLLFGAGIGSTAGVVALLGVL